MNFTKSPDLLLPCLLLAGACATIDDSDMIDPPPPRQDAGSVTDTSIGSDTDSYSNADIDTDTDTDGDGDVDGSVDSDADTDTDTDSDTDTDADANTDSDTDSDSDADSDTDTDTASACTPGNQEQQCGEAPCVDGYCCDSSCDGTCESCNIERSEGICTFVPDGEDPDDECSENKPATCGSTGVCDGTGQCTPGPAGACVTGQTCCPNHPPNYCYSLLADDEHCGSCTNKCGLFEDCILGFCG